MTGLVGQTLGRYEIVGTLGAGGMGEVYRARDTQLGRPVAIKVISAKVAQSRTAIDRFEREAKIVAQLSHPNILDIHDFGRDDGIVYAVTELLEGKDLRERTRKSTLPVSKALEIGIAVANGLAAAHSKGIVHRDIKPENVFITSIGHVKILDFGIAGLKTGSPEPIDENAHTESLTQTGAVVGTVGYMSPEQVRGEKVDPRSDIFALGCLLYEVLSGRRAFQGETSHDTAMAIMNRDPDPIASYRPDVPPGIEVVVRRCLEKEPEERFESARDVAFALQAITETGREPLNLEEIQRRRNKRRRLIASSSILFVTVITLIAYSFWLLRAPPPLPEKKHLAILPFSAVEDDEKLQASAAGLTHLVASGLSLVHQQSQDGFWFVPLAEVKKRSDSTLNGTHRIFNTTIAISGQLQRKGDRLRLQVDAIDAATGRPLRSFTIEDSLSNLSSFQEAPVIQICEILEIPLNLKALESLASTATTMPEGFDSYLRGIGLFSEGAEDTLDQAIGLLVTTVTLDPLFSAGRVALGRAYLEKNKTLEEPVWVEKATAEARRAIKDGPHPEDAYDLLADIHLAEGRQPESIEALEDAVHVAPESAEAHLKLARAYHRIERDDDSERHFQRAIFLRPGYWPAYDRLAGFYLDLGKYEAAATQWREVTAIAPQLTRGYNNLGSVLSWLGHVDEARDAFERSVAIEPSRSAFSNLGTLYFDGRRFADAAEMYERALDEDNSRYLTWGNLAFAYKFVPAPEKADDCFRKAVELAEEEFESEPDDLWTATDLASYQAMLGDRARGLELVDLAVAAEPDEPQLIAQIAEAFEDLGERERALEWIARSFDAGVPPSRFEGRPTLRELLADEDYQELVREKKAR